MHGQVDSVPKKKQPPRQATLKEVIALVRPGKQLATRQALEAAGIYSYTTTTVLGRSRQRGLRFQSEKGEPVAIKFMPKQYFSIMIDAGRVPAVIAALMKANRTGKGAYGDGKIFVVDIDDAVRISTDERGGEAI
ncbi:MAG: P-II family nitrogen regulator [Candidatus Manganitrophus sp.]|nr:P-II family nitrogen regulator [Candidatus Manganitrophus sp.]